MKKIKFLISTIIFTFVLCIAANVNAASASISCEGSGTVGNGIRISVSGTGVQWRLTLKVDGQTVASNSELENYESNKPISFSGTYTPTSVGNKTVTLEGSVTDFNTGATITSFPSKTINVAAASTNSSSSSSSGNSGSSSSSRSSSSAKTVKMITTSPVDFSGFKAANKGPYRVTVENDVKQLKIVVKYSDNSTNTVTKNLTEGSNSFNVDGYNIIATRKTSENSEIVPNTIDEKPVEEEEKVETLRLNNIVLDDTLNVKLDPIFNPEVFEYTVVLGNEYLDLEKLLISAIANIEGATITIDGNENLIEGENIVTITVEANGYDTVWYRIKVIKGPKEVETVETVAPVVNEYDAARIFRDRILISVMVHVIAFIGIIFIAKECYESTNNKEDKPRRRDEFKEDDEIYSNVEDKDDFEMDEEESDEDVDEYIEEKTEPEVEDKKEEIIEDNFVQENTTFEGNSENIISKETNDEFGRKPTWDDFLKGTQMNEFDEEEPRKKRRHGKGKHA